MTKTKSTDRVFGHAHLTKAEIADIQAEIRHLTKFKQAYEMKARLANGENDAQRSGIYRDISQQYAARADRLKKAYSL